VLRGHWYDNINRNSRAPTEDKRDDNENGFCKKLQRAFKQFTKYDMKYLLRDFKAKVREENILKPIVRNVILDAITYENSVFC
jgi:hypothetical protein